MQNILYFKINVGCGRTPTKGYKNFDNSPSLFFASVPRLAALLHKLSFIKLEQFEFISFCRREAISYADACRKIPLENDAAEVVYASHMLEHLYPRQARLFLKEAFRVLKPGGVIRIVVPDLSIFVKSYLESGNSTKFIGELNLVEPERVSLKEKIIFFFTGPRLHKCMYDSSSLSEFLVANRFEKPVILPPGSTTIPDPGELNLREREEESIYVEAVKPLSLG